MDYGSCALEGMSRESADVRPEIYGFVIYVNKLTYIFVILYSRRIQQRMNQIERYNHAMAGYLRVNSSEKRKISNVNGYMNRMMCHKITQTV